MLSRRPRRLSFSKVSHRNTLMNQKTRRSPRFSFIAVAEIAHTESGGNFSCRVSELSLNGCYVDMLNTLPIGSEVAIKIFAESECFEANVEVIYAHPNL